MRRFVSVCALLAWGIGCSSPSTVDGGPKLPPPQATVVIKDSLTIGQTLSGSVTTSGCATVGAVEIDAADGSFLINVDWVGNPSTFTIATNALNRFYAASGISLPLSLVAKVTCDDQRSNVSQPVSVTVFPAQSHTSLAGAQVLPDSFVAEGGLGGTATTFIGCIGYKGSYAIARVDTMGNVLAVQSLSNFNCSYNSVITDRSPVNFTRWLMEPGKGAVCFDKDLNITNTIIGMIEQIAVSRDGSAVFWINDGAGMVDQLLRANVQPITTNQPAMWAINFPGQMNATPVIDANNGWVYTLSWQLQTGTGIGNIVMLKYSYADGSLLNAVDNKVPVLISQDFGTSNTPIEPFGSFNIDGTLVYVPLIGFDANGNTSSAVLACGTGAGGCQGTTRRWQSPTFTSTVTTTLPFSSGNFIAAASDQEVYFLSVTDGSIQNLGGLRPLRPTSSSLRVKALQPGHGADFYIMAGPESNSYPSEVVAVDSPMNGELWHLDYGSGSTPLAGMFMAVDDASTAWIRIGSDSIKALSLTDYRTARGATPMPR